MTPQDLIDTEEEIRALWEAGEINSLLHLEGSVDGSYEQWLVDFFHSNVQEGDWILGSHRCHYIFQLYAWKNWNSTSWDTSEQQMHFIRNAIVEDILRGKSMFLFGTRFICSAIVAGTASIAVGLALGIQRRGGDEKVYCFLGDGASEHGHFLEAMAFVHAKKLPLQFIVTDNNSSCGVTKEQRRGSEDEIVWPPCVTKISYTPRFPHAGTKDFRPQLKSQLPPK